MLEIRVLGQFDVRLDGGVVGISSRPAQSLLAYLALHAGIAQRREKLAGLLWPEANDTQARNNLRYTLWQVRRSLEPKGSGTATNLTADKISVTLEAGDDVWVDALQLTNSPVEGRPLDDLIREASVYAGELLPGFYEEWVLLERSRLSAGYDQRMTVLLDRLAEEDRWAAVFEWSERWISLGHVPEAAYRGLMRAHFALGDASGLSASYGRCREALLQHLGVEPSSQTVRLFRELSQTLAVPSAEAGPERASPMAHKVESLPSRPGFLETGAGEAEVRKFAGHARELAKLESTLALAMEGRGQVVAVIGETGRGKTALVEEFSRRAEDRWPSLLVVSGNCDLYTGAGDPYLPFREVLSSLSGDVEPKWAAGSIPQARALRIWAAAAAMGEILAREGPDLIGPFVPGHILRGREGSSIPTTESSAVPPVVLRSTDGPPGSASPHRNRLFEEYTSVMKRLAEKNPLLIILEDVHWLDPSSGDLLTHVLHGLVDSPVLVVLTYRPEEIVSAGRGAEHPLGRVLADLKEVRGEFRIDLDQADDRASRELVDALVDLQPNDLDREFRANLARVTEGHPFFVLELLQDFQERGELARGPSGVWSLGGRIDWQITPAKVEGVIEKRIGRLDRELREALVIASVQGEIFTAEAIAPVLGVDERALVRRLTREVEGQHRLVHEVATERIGTRQLSQFRFRHILIQRYLYQRLGKGERTYLHEALGKALEDLYGEGVGRAAHRLARHFTEASLFDKAASYLRQAGEQALRVSAYQEAVAHLGRAGEMLSSGEIGMGAIGPGARADLERLLGEAYYGLGDIQRSGDHLGRAVALLGWPLPKDRRRMWAEVAKEFLRQAARRLFSWRAPTRMGSEAPVQRAAARVFKLLAETYVVSQDNGRTLHATLTSLNLAERAGPCAELASGYADMSAICPLLGLRALAEPYRRLARETAERVGDESVSAYVLLATSVFTLGEGRWEESQSSLDKAIDLFRRIGDWNRLGIAMTFRAHIDLFQGRFAAFAERHRELEELATRSGSFLHWIWAQDGKAEATLRTGTAQALAEAISALQSNLAHMKGKGFRAEEAVVYGLLAQALVRLNRFSEATEAADSAAERNRQSPPTFYSELEAHAGPVEGYLGFLEKMGTGSGHPPAVGGLRAARKDLHNFARIFPVARPRMEILDAWRAWLAGEEQVAYRTWLKAVAVSNSIQMPFEEAQARLELGRHMEAGDPRRLDHLQEARRIFAQIGAQFEVERVDGFLAGEAPSAAHTFPREG